MDGVRESTVLNTLEGMYTAHSVDEAQVRIYQEERSDRWNVKIHYDETGKREAFAICEEIDHVLEEEYDRVLGVDAIDFNQQLEEPVKLKWNSNTIKTRKVEAYQVSDRETGLNVRRYHRPGVEIQERDMEEVLPGLMNKAQRRSFAHRLGGAGLVGGEAILDTIPALPAEAALAAGGLGLLLVGEPVINAKTNLPTPSKLIAQRIVDSESRKYTMENEELDAALARRYTPEGETRWGWEDYEQHGTFDGKNLQEAWDITRFLDFETIEKKEGVTLTTIRDSYSDALDLVSHVTGRDLELVEAEKPILQEEALNAHGTEADTRG